MKNSYLFTSESVSEGHPDKICDRISDTVVDLMLKKYPEARVACETMVSTNRTIIAGEYRLPDGIYIENQEIYVPTVYLEPMMGKRGLFSNISRKGSQLNFYFLAHTSKRQLSALKESAPRARSVCTPIVESMRSTLSCANQKKKKLTAFWHRTQPGRLSTRSRGTVSKRLDDQS